MKRMYILVKKDNPKIFRFEKGQRVDDSNEWIVGRFVAEYPSSDFDYVASRKGGICLVLYRDGYIDVFISNDNNKHLETQTFLTKLIDAREDLIKAYFFNII